jgi:preprotein translocase SecE subunit
MARTRQQAKQRKAKRLEEERKAAERTQPRDAGDSASREALAEVERAQLDAAAELEEAQETEVGAGAEAARSAAAVEAATAAEAVSTGRATPTKVDEAPARVSRRERKRAEAEKEERRKPAAPARRARPARKDQKKDHVRQRGRVVNFFIQVWAELRRVQWPDRTQVTQATAVVVVFCLVAGAYLGLWDYVFNELVKRIL